MNALTFQKKAIDELIIKFKKLWNENPTNPTELILKSPTGSGKTFITTSFITELANQPDWQEDVAFVWITFSDDLAMQSRDKFLNYFSGNIKNQLLTTQDFSQGVLKTNDVLFINWQKLVSKKAQDRVLRRPEDERNFKESGFYFEDIVEATQKENRQVILIIDESHKNVTESANRDVISKLNPKMIIKVSATPFTSKADEDKFFALKGRDLADIVEVDRKDVVDEGLIKSKIVCQTEDELLKHKSENLDELMLDLAIERRNQIAEEWTKLGLNINPLVLIQLPNDDSELEKQGVSTKEEIVKNYLKTKSISDRKVASWFDGKKDNMDFITQNDCPVDFLLFKVAAGTGWDCPRAHVLVMFREIKSSVFQTQTLGRILRMPYIDSSFSNDLLTTGYLYTNYKSNEVGIPDQDGKNRPKVFTTEISIGTKKTLISHEIKNHTKKILDILPNKDDLDDEEKEKAVSEISQTISKIIETVPFETDDGKKDSEKHQKIKNEIQEKISTVKDNIEKVITDTLSTKTSISDETKKVIQETVAHIVSKTEEIACNETESEIVLDNALINDFLSRADYGDIGKVSEFQKCFTKFMNEFFGIDEHEILVDNSNKLKNKDVNLSTDFTQEVMANAVYHTEEKTSDDTEGKNVTLAMSPNDVEKNFTWMCYEILGEQTETDAKIGNRARSWSPFKEALRQWFKKYALSKYSDDESYRIFLNDTLKPQSIFKQAITFTLKKYRPILDAFINTRTNNNTEKCSTVFTIKSHYAYSDDYEIFSPANKSMVQPFYLPKDYNGRKNETDFIQYLETTPEIKSWFKNGDNGKEYFGIKYFSTEQNCYRLFYPDWIVLSTDNKIGIFDTKSGITASSTETKDKAETLHKKIEQLNHTSVFYYIGGIVIKENGQWYINNSENYSFNKSSLKDWKTLSWKASE